MLCFGVGTMMNSFLLVDNFGLSIFDFLFDPVQQKLQPTHQRIMAIGINMRDATLFLLCMSFLAFDYCPNLK